MDLSFIYANFSQLEADLGLPGGFTDGLIQEDDWSFVIKSHAAVEAAISHLLTKVTDPRLEEIFRHMNLGGGHNSKLAVMKALEMFDDPTRKFIGRLAELRNLLVHDVSYLSFNLNSYLKGLSTQERRNLSILIASTIAGPEGNVFVEFAEECLKEVPKETFAFALLAILAKTLFKLNPDEYRIAAEKSKESVGAVALFTLLILVIFAASSKGSQQ